MIQTPFHGGEALAPYSFSSAFVLVIYWHMFYAGLRAPEPFQTQRCRNGIHTCRRGVFVHHCTDEVTCPVPQSISQPQAIQFAAWAAHWAVAQLVRALGIVAGRCPSILASVAALHHVALVTVHGAEGGVDGIAQCGGP
jgi:hypothetical protein